MNESFSGMIPWQMQRDDLLFVKINGRDKGTSGIEKGWTEVKNANKWNDPGLLQHITRANYGYCPAPGSNILSLDVDNADSFHQAGGKELIKGTYRYSAWEDWHKYRAIVLCPDMPNRFRGRGKHQIKDKTGKGALELFFPASQTEIGAQCVAPGSIHPDTKRPYAAYDENAEILIISWVDIQALIDKMSPDKLDVKEFQRCNNSRPSFGRGEFFLITAFGLTLPDPDNKYLGTIKGETVTRGANPWHGSTSKGGNVAINDRFLFCFHHCKAHDAAACDAIKRKLMECGDVYTSDVYEKHFEELKHDSPTLWAKHAALYAARKAADETRWVLKQEKRRYVSSV